MKPLVGRSGLFRSGWVLALLTLIATSLNAADRCVPPPDGISAWYSFEGNTTDRLSGAPGVAPGVTYVPGRVGSAILLDGTTGVYLGEDTRFERSEFTIETWIRRSSLTAASFSSPADASVFAGGIGSYGLSLAADGRLFFSIIGVQSFNFGPSIIDLEWHHVAMTRSGTTVRLYLDGQAAGQLTVENSILSNGPYAIGSLPQDFGGQFFRLLGALDEFSFYPSALTPEQVQAIYTAGAAGKCTDQTPITDRCTLPSGIVAWYPLDTDSRELIANRPPVSSPSVSYAGGQVNGAAYFQGFEGGLPVPSSTLQSQEFTVEAWIRRSSLTSASSSSPGDGAIFAGGDGSFSITVRGTDGALFVSHVGRSWILSNVRISDLLWHHIAVTKSGGTVQFYLDGTLGDTVVTGVQNFDLSSPYAIGSLGAAYQGNWYTFLGGIDELSLYNRALTGDEVSAIAATGVNGKCPTRLSTVLQAPDEVILGQSASVTLSITSLASTNLPVIVTNTLPRVVTVTGIQATLGTVTLQQSDSNSVVRLEIPSLPAGATALLTIDVSGSSLGSGVITSVALSSEPAQFATASTTVLVRPECIEAPPGIAAWWPANGSTVDQISGRPPLSEQGVTFIPGRVGQAFRFDGQNGSGLNLGRLAELQRSEFSIEGWLRRTSSSIASINGNAGTILGADSTGWNFMLSHGGSLGFGRLDGGVVQTAPLITDLGWHHVAVTRSAGEVRFFVDGLAVTTVNYTEPLVLDLPYGLGGIFPSGRNGFLGDLDEVSFYRRVLTGDEIRTLATAGSAPRCSSDLALSSTVGGRVAQGEDLSAEFTVSSVGDDSSGVAFRFSVPAGMQFLSASASQGSIENLAGLIRGQLGSLPAGSNAVVTVVFRPLVAGQFALTASASRTEPELTLANNQYDAALDVRPLTVDLVGNVTVAEVPGQSVNALFEVSLSATSSKVVTVDYATVSGTALAGSDFTAVQGRLEFPPGVLSRQIAVPVLGDGSYEVDETFQLVLSNPANAGLGTATATGLIQSGDPLPVLTIHSLVLPEGQAGATPFRFEARLDRPSSVEARIQFATVNDTARAPTDFTAVNGTLVFAPGETRQIIEVTVNGDRAVEPNELFFLSLAAPVQLRLNEPGGPLPSGTIVNDDGVPGQVATFEWQVPAAPIVAGEATPLTLTARDWTGVAATSFDGTVEVKAYSGPGLPSPLVFTEVVTQNPGAVELQNVSQDSLDVSGWAVHFYDSTRWPAPKGTFVFPAGTLMPAGGVVTIASSLVGGGTYPSFRLGEAVSWSDRGTAEAPRKVRVGVILTDASLAVVDSFFGDAATPSEIAIPVELGTEDWNGTAAAGVMAPNTGYRRLAGLRRNSRTAADWEFSRAGSSDLGLSNNGMVLPYLDAVPIPIAPPVVSGFNNGVWTGDLTLSGFTPSVRLWADDGNGHRGLSAPVAMRAAEDLSITLITAQPVLTAGTLLSTVEATVRNLGTKAASNVTAVLVLPPQFGAPFDDGAMTVSQGTVERTGFVGPAGATQTRVTARLGLLAGGASATLTYVAGGLVPATSAGYPTNLTSTATLTAEPVELNLVNNTATLTQELSTACASMESAVAWWRADGTFESAISGLAGVSEGTTSFVNGRVGTGAFHFTGSNAVVVADSPLLDFTSSEPFVLEGWFRTPVSARPLLTLLSKQQQSGSATTGYALRLSQGILQLVLDDGQSTTVLHDLPSQDLRDGRWHHFMVGKDRQSALAAWVDGRMVIGGSAIPVTGTYANDATLRIGDDSDGTVDAAWIGEIDEIVVYRSFLIGTRATAAYRAGAHGHCASELTFHPMQPRFEPLASSWVARDNGVVGQPYRIEFEVRNSGPVTGVVLINAVPSGPIEFLQLQSGQQVFPMDPESGGATTSPVTVPPAGSIRLSAAFAAAQSPVDLSMSTTAPDLSTFTTVTRFTVPLASDVDGDGMPDVFEIASGLNPNSAADANTDQDGDGWTAAQEFEAGTRANDPASVLKVRIVDGQAVVDVLASRWYRVERRAALSNGDWTLIQSLQPATDGALVIGPVPGADDTGYYRVVVSLPY